MQTTNTKKIKIPKKLIQRFFNKDEDTSTNSLNKSIQNYIKKIIL